MHLTFQPLCIWIYPASDSAPKRGSSSPVNSSQEDICALSLSNISHLLFPQVQSNMEFTLLAFVYSLHRAGFFFFFLEIWLFWSYDFYKEVSALECSHLGNKNWKSGWEYWLNYHRHQNLTFSTKVCEISLPSGGTPVKPFPAAELRQHRLLPKQNRMVSLERRRPLAFSLPCGEDIGQVVFLKNWP